MVPGNAIGGRFLPYNGDPEEVVPESLCFRMYRRSHDPPFLHNMVQEMIETFPWTYLLLFAGNVRPLNFDLVDGLVFGIRPVI